ncbi:MAG: hypothetical protein FWC95_03220 [Defluviitaleaceae bacterium]|nr:hypothetical protein [Defluviitaleaceae bacterium]
MLKKITTGILTFLIICGAIVAFTGCVTSRNPIESMTILNTGFAGGIPDSMVDVTITPRDLEGYPWLAEITFISEDELNALIEEYGAIELRFNPVTQDDGVITWTRYEIIAPEGMDYVFVSWFFGDTMIRGEFNSLWLPLESIDDASPARYLIFADTPGEIILTTFTYTFRNWDEIAESIGLSQDPADTHTLNPAFPSLPINAPTGGWYRAPWNSSTVIIFNGN